MKTMRVFAALALGLLVAGCASPDRRTGGDDRSTADGKEAGAAQQGTPDPVITGLSISITDLVYRDLARSIKEHPHVRIPPTGISVGGLEIKPQSKFGGSIAHHVVVSYRVDGAPYVDHFVNGPIIRDGRVAALAESEIRNSRPHLWHKGGWAYAGGLAAVTDTGISQTSGFGTMDSSGVSYVVVRGVDGSDTIYNLAGGGPVRVVRTAPGTTPASVQLEPCEMVVVRNGGATLQPRKYTLSSLNDDQRALLLEVQETLRVLAPAIQISICP